MLRHVGIVVADLRGAIAFWEAAGFTVKVDARESSKELDAALDMKSVELRSVKMADERGQIIELVRYSSHRWTDRNSKPPRPYSMGVNHVALTVPSMAVAYARLSSAGAFFHGPPQRMGAVQMVYCRGPEGILIELVEES